MVLKTQSLHLAEERQARTPSRGAHDGRRGPWARWVGRNWARLHYAVRVEPTWLEVNRLDIPIRGLPAAFDGLRIVQLSDFHCGRHVTAGYLQEAVDLAHRPEARRDRPDRRLRPQGLPPRRRASAKLLGRLQAPARRLRGARQPRLLGPQRPRRPPLPRPAPGGRRRPEPRRASASCATRRCGSTATATALYPRRRRRPVEPRVRPGRGARRPVPGHAARGAGPQPADGRAVRRPPLRPDAQRPHARRADQLAGPRPRRPRPQGGRRSPPGCTSIGRHAGSTSTRASASACAFRFGVRPEVAVFTLTLRPPGSTFQASPPKRSSVTYACRCVHVFVGIVQQHLRRADPRRNEPWPARGSTGKPSHRRAAAPLVTTADQQPARLRDRLLRRHPRAPSRIHRRPPRARATTSPSRAAMSRACRSTSGSSSSARATRWPTTTWPAAMPCSGKTSLALKTLRRAIELGYRDFRYMREDRDLDSIRKDPASASSSASSRTAKSACAVRQQGSPQHSKGEAAW